MSIVTSPFPKTAPVDALLENGDHLSREEFERRYEKAPPEFRAELIEGVVHVASPVREMHARPHAVVAYWLSSFDARTPGVEALLDVTVRLDEDNVVQPDATLRIVNSDTLQTAPDGYLEGAPELAVEIAASSASYDLHQKKNVYRRAGVQEYVVWRVLDDAVDWFVNREGRFVEAEPDDGWHRSITFPGLWLDTDALISRDLARVAAGIQRGLEGDKHHTEFVRRITSP